MPEGAGSCPRRLGKFEIVRRIGVGGMAEVYEALLHGAEGFRRRLALKTLLPGMREDPHVIDMFIDEATIVAGLEHRNIVSVYEFGEIEGTHYLAMEYVDGPTLRQLQRRLQQRAEPFPVAAAACCVREICHALEYIHGAEQQIVHRDVTPQNVFVDRQGVVKLADFGIAKTAARRSQTASGQIKGKLMYLAPEQVTEERVTPQTDVYAAGLILFELLTGEPLISGRREVDVIRAAMNPPLRRPSETRPEAVALDRVVLHALEKHPALRYPNAALFAADLERYLLTQGQTGAGQLLALLTPDERAPREPPGDRSANAGQRAGQSAHPGTLSITPGTPVLPAVAERDAALQAHPPQRTQPPRRRYRAAAAMVTLAVGSLAIGALLLTADGPSRQHPTRAVLADGATASAPGPGLVVAPDALTTDAGSGIAAARAADAAGALVVEGPADRAIATTRARSGRRRPHRSRRARRPSRPRDSELANRTPARDSISVTPPPATAQPDVARLRQRLAAALAAAAERGLYPGDEPQLDRLIAASRQQLAAGQAHQAARSLGELERRAGTFRIDRRFADRKLARLSAAISRANLPEAQRLALEGLSQQILQLIIAGEYVAASRTMTRARGRLQRAR